jgi:hypothetical protein
MLPVRATANPVPIQPESLADPIPCQNTSIRFVSEFINVTFREMVYVTAQYQFRNSNNTDEKQTICLPFAKPPMDLSLSAGNESVRATRGEFILRYEIYTAYTFDIQFKPLEEKNLTATFRAYHEQDRYWDAATNETGERYEFTYLTTTGRAWGRPIEKAVFQFNIRKDLCDIGPSRDFWDGSNVTVNETAVIVKREETDWTPGSDIQFKWVDVWWKPVACLEYGPCRTNRNETVFFDLSRSYDPDGSVCSYYFDFGDGTAREWVQTPFVTHVYTRSGLFFPLVRARDNTTRESEMLRAGPIAVETGQEVLLDKDHYILLEITSGLTAKGYSINPEDQILDGCCDFEINDDLKLIIARNTAKAQLEGVYSTPHSSAGFDILDISGNGSVTLSLDGPAGPESICLGALDSWPPENLSSRCDAVRITDHGIWSKSRFRHWGPPATITTTAAIEVSRLLRDRDGAYRSFWAGRSGIWHSASEDARIWSAPQRLPIGTNTTQFDGFHIMQDRNGTFWLVWSNYTTYDTNRYDLWISSSKDLRNWSCPRSLPEVVINTPVDEHCPYLIQDRNGLYWLAYSSDLQTPSGIFLATSKDCLNWSGPVSVESPYQPFAIDSNYNPMIMQDRKGTYWLVWSSQRSYPGTNRVIFYSTSADGLSWSLPARFSFEGEDSFDRYASLSQDIEGVFWIVWESSGSLAYSSSLDGQNWAPSVLTNVRCIPAPSILMDLRGKRILHSCSWIQNGRYGISFQELAAIDLTPQGTSWIATEYPDITPPRVLAVSVKPDTQEPGGEVEIVIRVLDNRGVDKVVLNITGPKKFRELGGWR